MKSNEPKIIAHELATYLMEEYPDVSVSTLHLAVAFLYKATAQAWVLTDTEKRNTTFIQQHAKKTYEDVFGLCDS